MADSLNSLLNNNYWVLRHGRSIPNEKGLIVSSLENGIREDFGLAAEGINQAKLAGQLFQKELKEKNVSLDKLRIFYSPFSRTIDTAKQVTNVLGIPFESSNCKAMVEIRERYFGPELELQSSHKYNEIWAIDEKNPFFGPEGCESVADVASRLSTILTCIETSFKGCVVLIVSHGDTLQILQTLIHSLKQNSDFSKEEDFESRIKRAMIDHSALSQHRNFALQTGELRSII